MTAGDLLSAYEAMVAGGALREDPRQHAVARCLDGLHVALDSQPPPPSRLWRLVKLIRSGDEKVAPPRGLYIHGPPGRGKSMLMDLFFDLAPVAARRRVHVHPFMQEVHAKLHEWRKASAGRGLADPLPHLALEIAQTTRLLCFDEFQVEAIADAMIVRRLFGALFDCGVVVVATSNTAPDDLYAGGLQRDRFLPFIGLLKEHLDVVELGGETDYRRDRLKAVGIYHQPLGPETDAELADAFDQLADGAPGEPDELTVQGRPLAVSRQARGVACFSFAELCDKPLGPADYWAIACRYQTVILSGIPRMTARERNSAKRFATLIETLYEQRVKLVCSADAPAGELYREGDGAVLFQRVVSRLEEMQSEDYLTAAHRPSSTHAAAA